MLPVIFTSAWYHSCSFSSRWLICKEYTKQWGNLTITSDQGLDAGISHVSHQSDFQMLPIMVVYSLAFLQYICLLIYSKTEKKTTDWQTGLDVTLKEERSVPCLKPKQWWRKKGQAMFGAKLEGCLLICVRSLWTLFEVKTGHAWPFQLCIWISTWVNLQGWEPCKCVCV